MGGGAAASQVSSSRARDARRRGRPRALPGRRAARATAPPAHRRRRRARRGPRRSARTGSAQAADVVDDRRHAGAERAQERAATGRARRGRGRRRRSPRRARARARPRRGTRAASSAPSERRGYGQRLERVAGDDEPCAVDARDRLDRVGRPACTAGSRRARAPSARRRRRGGSLGEDRVRDHRSFSASTPSSASVVAAALAVDDDRARTGRTAAARGRASRAVRRGRRSWAVKTSGAREPEQARVELRATRATAGGATSARASAQPREAERVLDRLHRQPQPRAAEEARARAGRRARAAGSRPARARRRSGTAR